MSLSSAFVDRASHHHLDDGRDADLVLLQRSDVLPVAEDRDAVGETPELVHAMRDVDDAGAGGLQLIDEPEERLDLRVGERGGGLVHDEHLRVERERFGDLDHLLLGDGQLTDLLPRVQLDVEARQQLAGLPIQRALRDERAAHRLPADVHVLRDREVGHHVQLLVDDRDPQLLGLQRAGQLDRLALEEDLSLVAGVDAGEDLHQRGLAGAVLTDEDEDLARSNLEVHILQRLHAGKPLADSLDLEDRIAHTHLLPRRSDSVESISNVGSIVREHREVAQVVSKCIYRRSRLPDL